MVSLPIVSFAQLSFLHLLLLDYILWSKKTYSNRIYERYDWHL